MMSVRDLDDPESSSEDSFNGRAGAAGARRFSRDDDDDESDSAQSLRGRRPDVRRPNRNSDNSDARSASSSQRSVPSLHSRRSVQSERSTQAETVRSSQPSSRAAAAVAAPSGSAAAGGGPSSLTPTPSGRTYGTGPRPPPRTAVAPPASSSPAAAARGLTTPAQPMGGGRGRLASSSDSSNSRRRDDSSSAAGGAGGAGTSSDEDSEQQQQQQQVVGIRPTRSSSDASGSGARRPAPAPPAAASRAVNPAPALAARRRSSSDRSDPEDNDDDDDSASDVSSQHQRRSQQQRQREVGDPRQQQQRQQRQQPPRAQPPSQQQRQRARRGNSGGDRSNRRGGGDDDDNDNDDEEDGDGSSAAEALEEQVRGRRRDQQQDDGQSGEEEDEEEESEGESEGESEYDRRSYDDAASLRSAYTADTYFIADGSEPQLSEAEENQRVQELTRGMPDCFGPAALAKAAKQAGKQLAPSLMPKVNASGLLLFTDLLLPDVRRPEAALRRNNLLVKSFRVKLAGAHDIPLPGGGVEVKHRMVRVCLFDAAHPPPQCYVSNVHGFSANWLPSKPLEWKFPSRGGLFAPRSNEDIFVVRTSNVSESACLLFELSLIVKRSNSQQQQPQEQQQQAAAGSKEDSGEISVGWCKLPLFRKADVNAVSLLLDFGVHDMPLSGAKESFLKRTDLSRNTKTSAVGDLLGIGKAKGAALKVKLMPLDTMQEAAMQSNLPDNLVVQLSTVPLLHVYRELLADAILPRLSDAAGGSEQQQQQQPVLVAFQRMLQSTDHVEAFKAVWNAKYKAVPRNSQTNVKLLKGLFQQTVLQLWPLLCIADMPTGVGGDPINSAARFEIMHKVVTDSPTDQFVTNKSNFAFKPFSVDEILYSPI